MSDSQEPKEYELGEPIIQLYSPFSYHTSAAIVLNEKGRKKLIEALQSSARIAVIDAFVQDGEGFDLGIFVLPEKEIRKLKDPYMHDWGDNSLSDPCEEVERIGVQKRKNMDKEHA